MTAGTSKTIGTKTEERWGNPGLHVDLDSASTETFE